MQTSHSPAGSHGSFHGLGISPQLLEVLDRMKFHTPTPIQEKAIPVALEGQDVIGIAQTGTGKTLAFGIPMIQRLAQKKGKGLVLVPTRELAMQVHQNIAKLDHKQRPVILIGGQSMYRQIQDLRRNPRIIIATPGRLIDHLEQRNVHLQDVITLVMDEADRMFDMGFAPQIREILRQVPKERQTLLFSATMPPTILQLASSCMQLPVQVEIAKQGTVAEKITQELFIVRHDAKKKLLMKLVTQYHGAVLVFSRTKIGAKHIARFLREAGQSAAELHADRTLGQRKEALEGFKSGRYRILVATDIAARGIDVYGIELVINYDLPDDVENYVHRIGRTGRAGGKGHAVAFATPDQGKHVRDIEKMTRMAFPIGEHPEFPKEDFTDLAPAKRPSGFGGAYGGGKKFHGFKRRPPRWGGRR